MNFVNWLSDISCISGALMQVLFYKIGVLLLDFPHYVFVLQLRLHYVLLTELNCKYSVIIIMIL